MIELVKTGFLLGLGIGGGVALAVLVVASPYIALRLYLWWRTVVARDCSRYGKE